METLVDPKDGGCRDKARLRVEEQRARDQPDLRCRGALPAVAADIEELAHGSAARLAAGVLLDIAERVEDFRDTLVLPAHLLAGRVGIRRPSRDIPVP